MQIIINIDLSLYYTLREFIQKRQNIIKGKGSISGLRINYSIATLYKITRGLGSNITSKVSKSIST